MSRGRASLAVEDGLSLEPAAPARPDWYALARLAVLGRLALQGSRYTLPAAEAGPAERRTTRSGSRRS